MTTTTLLNAVSIGTTPAAISNVTLHTFAATSGAFSLQASLTAGAAESNSRPVVWYAPIADANAATIAGAIVAQSAAFRLELDARRAVQARLFTTDTYACRGRYLLIWTEEPNLVLAATLTVKVTEF